MMKILITLALVALCQAGTLENSVATRLTAPSIMEVITRDENFLLFEFYWTRVQSGLWTDPVIGYKMRVWQVPDAPSANVNEYTLPDGKYKVQVEERQGNAESMDVTKNLNNILLAEIRTPADLLTAPYFNVRIGINYEIRVAAYTQTAQSTYSNYVRLRVLPASPSPTMESNSVSIRTSLRN